MGIFEMDASAIESLRSSTYNEKKKKKKLIIRPLYYSIVIIVFPRRILKSREVK